MKRLLMIPLAASFAVGLSAAPAQAIVYDARTLGMGNTSIGYSGNASLAYWNPASVAMTKTWGGVYLPSFGLSLSNNLLSVGEVVNFATLVSKVGQPAGSGGAPTSDVFTNLGSSNGLNLQMDALVEPIGLSLGKVGPGAVSFRLYGHAFGSAQAKLSSDFAENLNGLFFEGGFTNIATTIQGITATAQNPDAQSQEKLKGDVATLKSQLSQYMSAFVLTGSEKSTTKSLDLNATTGANAAAAFTYSQLLPFKLAAFPDAEISVGGTGKIFGAVNGMLPGNTAITLPGGSSNAKISPVGTGVGASIKLDIDREVTDLAQAIDRFQAEQNIATTADLAAKTGAFFDQGLSKSKIGFSNIVPDNVGFGIDVGTVVKLNKQVSLGLALINPLPLWGATQTNYTYDFSGNEIRLISSPSSRTNFSAAEPFVVRTGVAYKPQLVGPPILVNDLMLNAGFEAPLNNGMPPTLSVGLEKLFGPLALRLGTQQLGLAPLYTFGFGLQTSGFQLNFGMGVDNPSARLKAAAAALTLGVGF